MWELTGTSESTSHLVSTYGSFLSHGGYPKTIQVMDGHFSKIPTVLMILRELRTHVQGQSSHQALNIGSKSNSRAEAVEESNSLEACKFMRNTAFFPAVWLLRSPK